MSDFKHLTDEGGDATDFERELLRAAQDIRLSPQEKQAIWAGVALQALPAASGSTAAASAATPAAGAAKVGVSAAPWLKGLLALAAFGGISAGIYGLARRPTAPEPAKAAPARVAPIAAPGAATTEPPASEAPSVAKEDAPIAFRAGTGAVRESAPIESKSALRDESLAVLEIRRTLRVGDPSGALRLLQQARQRFPRGALSQEREALSIEALAKSGARDVAARHADAFLRAYPKSPYAADVQSFESH